MDIKSALIVDDSKMAQIVLKKQLVSRNINVYTADSGENAMEFLEQNELPDIIFMDCLMPGIDGFETTQKILEKPEYAKTTIVMCTGKESDEDKQKALDLGAAGYMSKSSSSAPLQAIIDEFNKQEMQYLPSKDNIDLADVTKVAKETSQEVANEIAMNISTKVATATATEIAMAQISKFSEKFSAELLKKSNREHVYLVEQFEQKVISSVKLSLKDTHDYIDSKVSHIDESLIPGLKNELKFELSEMVSASLSQFKTELNQTDIKVTINDIVDEKIHDAIENNLTRYVSLLLDHEVAQNLIDSKIQEQLVEQNAKVQSLEDRLAENLNSNSNSLSVIALLIGLTALGVSLYSLVR